MCDSIISIRLGVGRSGGRMDWSSGRFRWSAYGFLAKFLVGVVRLLHLVLRRLKLSVFDNGSNVLMPY